MKLLNIVILCAFIAFTNAIFAGRSFEVIPAPYFASIRFSPVGVAVLSLAGGSIISNQHILCAASTIQQSSLIVEVLVGGNTRNTQRVFHVQRSVQHPDYVHATRINNIGIIFLSDSIRFDSTTRPIALPSVEYENYPFENVQGQVLGFGGNATNFQQQGSSILEGAFVRVTANARCLTFFQNNPVASEFCAEDLIHRSDFCAQDVGGGFVMQNRGIEIIVGIASNMRCTLNIANVPSLPALYSRVAPHVEWIRNQTGI